MLDKIEEWIDATNEKYSNKSVSCICLENNFSGFYPKSFLRNSRFVVVDRIPKPEFPELRKEGLGDFIDMDVDGITYKNTYYVVPKVEGNLQLHFHELVHVAQWGHLGAKGFISRYIQEIQNFGYYKSPLEEMAYELDKHYAAGGAKFDVPRFVEREI